MLMVIMFDIKSIFHTWKVIFGNFKYLLLAIVVAVAFYTFNVLLPNFKALISFYSSLGPFGTARLFLLLMIGFWNTIRLHSFITLIIISILFGMLVSIISFRVSGNVISRNGKKHGVLGGVGIFLAALVPGCAACGIGLLSVLGLSTAFLTFLPFEGLELSILAIGILVFVILKTSKDLTECDVCKVNLNFDETKSLKR